MRVIKIIHTFNPPQGVMKLKYWYILLWLSLLYIFKDSVFTILLTWQRPST